MELAIRLYEYYKHRIDYYRQPALEYHLKRHLNDLKRAKSKGWDTSLPQEPAAYRYYGAEIVKT